MYPLVPDHNRLRSYLDFRPSQSDDASSSFITIATTSNVTSFEFLRLQSWYPVTNGYVCSTCSPRWHPTRTIRRVKLLAPSIEWIHGMNSLKPCAPQCTKSISKVTWAIAVCMIRGLTFSPLSINTRTHILLESALHIV